MDAKTKNQDLAASKRTLSSKTVMLGDSAVGKSSLVLHFVQNMFFEYQEPTIGAAFLCKSVTIDNNVVKFEIWDTAGQERYHSLTPMYYRNARAAVVVYDVTNGSSFVRAQMWVRELQHDASKDVVIALVGNKIDLEEDRLIDFEEGEAFAREKHVLFFETSAKTGQNIKQLFQKIAQTLVEKSADEQQVVAQAASPTINLKTTNFSYLLSKCCEPM